MKFIFLTQKTTTRQLILTLGLNNPCISLFWCMSINHISHLELALALHILLCHPLKRNIIKLTPTEKHFYNCDITFNPSQMHFSWGVSIKRLAWIYLCQRKCHWETWPSHSIFFIGKCYLVITKHSTTNIHIIKDEYRNNSGWHEKEHLTETRMMQTKMHGF